MKKRLVAVSLVLAMGLSLAACGASDKGGASDSSSSDGMIELSFWHSADSTVGEIVQKQIDTFNETVGAEKNIHVTGVFQDWPGTDALTAAMSTDDVENMPDVIQMYSEYVYLIRDWERTAWVEDFITSDDSSVKKEDLLSNAVSAYSLDGKMLGAPYAISTLLLYYNQDLLSEAGYEEPPKTIDDMADVITAVTEKTDAEYGLNARIQQFEFESFTATQGENGTYFGNNESGRSGYMTELACQKEIENYLDEWEKVIDTGGYKATKDSMNEEFAQGLNAMCLMSSTQIPTITDLVGDSFEWGVTSIPKVNENDIGGGFPSGSGLFMIDRGDEKKLEATWEFVQYMISPEAQSMWLDGYSYIPVNNTAAETDTYKAAVEANPRLAVPYEILSNAPSNMVQSFCPSSSGVNDVIKNAMLNFAQGTATKEETYNEIVDGIQAEFDDYFRANPIE